MAIVGSVVVTPTVSALTLTAETATFPQAGLTIVKVLTNGVYLSIPIDSSRNAILPAAGGNPTYAATNAAQISGTGRDVTWKLNGTVLNYSIYSLTTTPTTVFYYGTPIPGDKPLANYAGVATTVTLSSGAGTGTLTFPGGGLTMTGISATMGLVSGDGSGVIEISFATSAGQTFNAFIPGALLTQNTSNTDILPVSFPVAQTLAITLALGTTADKIVVYAFYSGTPS